MGLNIPRVNFLIPMWTLLETLRSDVESVFVSKHYDVFLCKTKVTIFGTSRIYMGIFLYAPLQVKSDIFVFFFVDIELETKVFEIVLHVSMQ